MASITIDQARAKARHQIAGELHLLLAGAYMSKEQFKHKLEELSFNQLSLVDAVFAAEPDAGEIDVRSLALMALVLDAEWDFKIERLVPETLPDAV